MSLLCTHKISYNIIISISPTLITLHFTNATNLYASIPHTTITSTHSFFTDNTTPGNAWKNHGTTWSLGMCMEDSDGDGFSNGDEMGDPCCKWVAGTTPQRTRNLANPAQKDSIPYPSCTKGGMHTLFPALLSSFYHAFIYYFAEPKVTLTANLTTQSSAVININWVVPSCMCGFNVSLVNPKAANNIQATAVADPFSGGSQIFMTGLEPCM